MRLVRNGSGWSIEGDGKERARIAYASLEGDKIVYGKGEYEQSHFSTMA